MALLLRDQFLTDANPLVDGAAEPGPGPRDVTGTTLSIIDGSLRGGVAAGTPAWGSRKLTYPSHARQDGLTLWAVVKPNDKDSEQGFGWASSAAVTNPETDGHHWINDAGYPRVSTPGKLITLNGFPDNGKIGAIRPIEYLVGVTLRAQGAFYWISAAGPQTRSGVNNSNDYPGIPQYPDARVLWVEDTDTTSPMFPHAGFRTAVGPIHDNRYEDVRVEVVPEWATEAGLASFLERFTRPDSTTSPGPGWIASGGTGGVIGNQGYIVANGGSRTYIEHPNANTSGDGIWRWTVTVGSTPSHIIECHFRYVDTGNFALVMFNSGSAMLFTFKAGSFNNVANYPFSLSAGQEIDVCAVTKGDRYQLILDGNVLLDYVQDTTAAALTGTGIGYGAANVLPTGARWDNITAIPSTITLPAEIQAGAAPHVFTPAAAIATDDFTAPDGTLLNGRTTSTGGKEWTASGGGTWQTSGNKAINTEINGAGDVHHYLYLDAGTPDYEVSVDITGPAVDDWLIAGLVVRRADANNFIYIRQRMGSDQPNNDEIEIHECVNGTFLGITKGQFGNYFPLGGTKNLTLHVVGNVMHVFLAGELVITYTIASQLTGTGVGLYHSSRDDGSEFGNFNLNAIDTGGATHPLDGASIGESAASASGLSVHHALSGDSAGVSAAGAGAISVAHALSGSSLGVSSALADRILAHHPLAGQSLGTSDATGALLIGGGKPLAGESIGTSSAAVAKLSVAHALAGTSLGLSSAEVARLLMERPLGGESVGTSGATANLTRVPFNLVAYDAARHTPSVGASRRTPATFDASRQE